MQELVLKQFCDEDIELMKKWLVLPHVKEWYHDENDWIEEIEGRKTTYSFVHHFIAYVDNEPMGFCQYYDYRLGGEDWHGCHDIKNTYSIDYMIGEQAYLHKGFGKAIAKAIIKEALKELDCDQVIVQPEPLNFASRGTCKAAGLAYDEKNDVYYIKK